MDKRKLLVENLQEYLNTTEINKPVVEQVLARLLIAYKNVLPPFDNPEQFMKTFRQVDVTPFGHVDMSIWLLMQESEDVWSIIVDTYYQKGK